MIRKASLSTRLLPQLGFPYNQLAALASHSPLDQVCILLSAFRKPEPVIINDFDTKKELEKELSSC